MYKEFDRRWFLSRSASWVLDRMFLGSLPKDLPLNLLPDSWTERLAYQFGEENLGFVSLYNRSIIPEVSREDGFQRHDTKDPIFMAVEFGNRNIWGYGDGVREAISRGQKVILSVGFKEEYPGDEEFIRYFQEVFEKYKGAEVFIVANEINASDGLKRRVSAYALNPALYAKVFKMAYGVGKRITPKTKLSLYGEAHDGNGEILREVIKAVLAEGVSPDAMSFHVYGSRQTLPSELESRVGLYEKVAQEFGLLHIPLHLTELGNLPEEASNLDQADAVWVGMASALPMVSNGRLSSVVWSVAYDPHHPEISLYEYDEGGRLTPKSAAIAWLLAARILNNNVTVRKSEDGLRVTKGYTSRGRLGAIYWNEGNEQLDLSIPDGFSCYDGLCQKVNGTDIILSPNIANVAILVKEPKVPKKLFI